MESEPTPRDLIDALAGSAHLRLLVLHGSRATGTHHEGSDRDLCYLADGPIDVETLHARLTTVLGTDAVDLVDPDRASAVLRFRAARDGRPSLAERLGRAAGFRNVIVHADADLDLERVRVIAGEGPTDLLALIDALARS